MGLVILQSVSLFLAGLLAGIELLVRYGVRPALAIFDEQAQILDRQGLIRRPRVVVASILVPTVLAGTATLVFTGGGPGWGFRWAAVAALLALVLVTAPGTVPINIGIGAWSHDAPPEGWHPMVRRWGRLDVLRSSAAIMAFAFLVASMGVQLTAG